MAVYKRGSIYWVRFTWNGEEIRVSARTTSRAEAKAYEKELREQYGRIARGGQPRRTFVEALERYLTENLPDLKIKTQERYKTSSRMLLPHFEKLYLDQFTEARLAEYRSSRKAGGASNSTINRDMIVLSAVFRHAVEDWGWLKESPFKKIKKLKEPKERVRYLTRGHPGEADNEYQRLLAAANSKLRAMIIVAVGTGMRLEEQFSLTWPQVNFFRREITLTVTKSDRRRIVPMSDEVIAQISAQPRHIREPYIFWHGGDGKRYSNVRTAFETALRNAKIKDFTWHDLRHTFASWAVQDGMDIYKLSQIMGHSSVSVTMRYAHLRVDDLHKAMEGIGTKVGTEAPV